MTPTKRPVGRPPGKPTKVIRIRVPVAVHADLSGCASIAAMTPDALAKQWIYEKLKRSLKAKS